LAQDGDSCPNSPSSRASISVAAEFLKFRSIA
jgi:hypothetical protein